MGKSGPTPRFTDDKRVTRKRVKGVSVRRTAVVLPSPPEHWLETVQGEYLAYGACDAARALSTEDIPMVRDYFALRDLMVRARDAGEIDKAVKLQGMERRLANDLGIGPIARARLGIQVRSEPSKLDAFLAGVPHGC